MNHVEGHAPTVTYTYKKPDLKNWLHCFSTHLDVQLLDDSFEYPASFAEGYARVNVIEEGLSYRIVQYKLNQDAHYSCEPSPDFNLVIYFYEFVGDGKIVFEIGNEIREHDAPVFRASVLSNSRIKHQLKLKEGTLVKGITLQLSEEWITKKLRHSDVKNIQLLKQTAFLQDLLSAKTQKIFNDIFNNQLESPFPELYATTRVLRLLEAFLENIFKKEISDTLLSISSKDFESILKIEGLLMENYNEVFPKIEKLARMALMSESKLKKIYKQAFGMGLYEYYQKNRMHKAKELLNTGAYSVSEVGAMLGYHNLSNFSSSFKKEFNRLPREIQMVE